MKLLNRQDERRIANAVIADPEEHTVMDEKGGVRSVQAANVEMPDDIDFGRAEEIRNSILDDLPDVDGLRVELGGFIFAEFEEPNSEVLGLAFAIVILIVAFGSVLAMGTFISASTKIVDRATGKVHMGRVPPYSVVVSGSLPGKPLPDGSPGPSLYCAVIVKTVDAQTRSKTGINELLRD